jgi:hypothetical protein
MTDRTSIRSPLALLGCGNATTSIGAGFAVGYFGLDRTFAKYRLNEKVHYALAGYAGEFTPIFTERNLIPRRDEWWIVGCSMIHGLMGGWAGYKMREIYPPSNLKM